MNLDQTQRWMSSLIMRPLSERGHMNPHTEEGGELAQQIDDIIQPSSKLTAIERLEIYNRQYWYRLWAALQDDFPALLALIGKQAFRELADAYLTECPSTSYTLRDLGSRLESWLSKHPGFGAPYPEAAVDAARLEWAYVEAFDAAKLPAARTEDLAAAGEQAKLRLQPHVRLVELRCAIDEFVAKKHDYDFLRRDKHNRRFGKDRFVPGETFGVVVYRRNDQVGQMALEVEGLAVLNALDRGAALGDALEAAFLESSIPPEQIASRVQQWFAVWSGAQLFTVAAENPAP